MNTSIIKQITTLACCIAIISCKNSDLQSQTTPPLEQGVEFSLQTPTDAETKATTALHTVDFYLTNPDDSFTTGVKTKYSETTQSIIIEGLNTGEYTLHILATSGNPQTDNATIHTLENIDEQWLTFDSETLTTLSNEYFHTSHNFSVVGGMVEDNNSEITLSRLVGRRAIDIDYGSQYVEQITTQIELNPNDIQLYSSFSGKAQMSSPKPLETITLTENKYITILPAASQNHQMAVRHHTQEHNGGRSMTHNYSFDGDIAGNSSGVIKLEFNHPMQNYGIRYKQDSTVFPRILMDGESYLLTNDPEHRSFNVNAPLQTKMLKKTEGDDFYSTFHIRFYSLRAVNDVTIWGKPSGYNDYIEIAHFDSIPQLGELYIPLPEGTKTWKTKGGSLIELDIARCELTDIHNQSDDPYMQMIATINPLCKWYIWFHNYGADPVTGATSGNWMVMTPDHARSAITMLTNMAYMLSLKDFQDHCLTYQGRIFANDAVTPVNMSEICFDYMRQGTLRCGSSISYGMGSGIMFGIMGGQWNKHFTGRWCMDTAWHEFAHCLGYNHSSCMASYGYGLWCANAAKDTCALDYYLDNVKSFPYPDDSVLIIN